MPPLSAADSISPAFARTKLVLFSPFRKGRTWKLSATAYLATAGDLFLPFPFVALLFLPAFAHFGKLAIFLLATASVLLTALLLFLFVLFSRLQFVFFDLVLNRGELVAPAWRKYGAVSLAWTWLKVLVGFVLILALAAPIATYSHRLLALFREMSSLKPGQMPPMEFFAVFYGGFFLIYFCCGVLYFLGSLGYDFLVPSLALEGVPLTEALRRMIRLIRGEPGQFALYCLLKVVLGLVGYMGLNFAIEIVLLLALLVTGVIAVPLGFLLHLAGVATIVLIGLGIALAAAIYFFILFYAMVIGIGTILTFLEAYSLYFLAGRYPLLGEHLAQSTPPPAPPPWNPSSYIPLAT